MKNMKSQFWAGFAVAVVALAGISTYAYWGGNLIDKGSDNSPPAQNTPDPAGTCLAGGAEPCADDPSAVPSGQANVTGTITCLPHKGDGPHTMECAIGLKSDDGQHYALTNMNYPDMADVQDYVRVRGTLTKPGASNYDIVGSIAIDSLQKI